MSSHDSACSVIFLMDLMIVRESFRRTHVLDILLVSLEALHVIQHVPLAFVTSKHTDNKAALRLKSRSKRGSPAAMRYSTIFKGDIHPVSRLMSICGSLWKDL